MQSEANVTNVTQTMKSGNRNDRSTIVHRRGEFAHLREKTTAQIQTWEMAGEQLQALGKALMRYGLVVVVAWIGAMKFTAYEANGIQPLVANSPLMSWVYTFLSVQAFSNVLGIVEIAIAAMIALRPVSAQLAALGSGLAVVMLLTTVSFLFSTPGWEPSLGGFPALSVVPGQFLVKDIVLLGVALWSLGDALKGKSDKTVR